MAESALNQRWQKLHGHGQHWMQAMAQRLAAVGVQRWKLALMVVLAAWVLANLARLVWLLLPAPAAPAVDPTPPINATSSGTARTDRAAVDIEAMVGWHLFGEAGAQQSQASAANTAAVEEQAQETTLNLQLLGLVSASDPTQSLAIIMADGSPQRVEVGKALPGNGRVVLNKVLVDRVIIDNNGRFETLWLYNPEQSSRQSRGAGTPLSANAPGRIDLRNDPRVAAAAQGYRQQLYRNPASLSDIVQVAPAHENGKLKGYRVNPGRNAKEFQQFGFKPGDVVTSVNGIGLDDPQRALELYNTIRTAQEATFTVNRGDQNITLTVSLQDAGTGQDAQPQAQQAQEPVSLEDPATPAASQPAEGIQ